MAALGARWVVIGRDCRASSRGLLAACADGLIAGGAEVSDLGLCGTEEVYCAIAHFAADGGIAVTGSHNPIEDNGMNLARDGAAPLDAATRLAAIKALAEGGDPPDLPDGRLTPGVGARSLYRPGAVAGRSGGAEPDDDSGERGQWQRWPHP